MNIKPLILGLAVFAMSSAAGAAYAHHSYAMFDESSKQTLTGVVKEFQWTNPHGWIHVEVTDEQGEAVVWSIESGAPAGMARQGWRPTTIGPGDEIEITFHPLRNGNPGGNYMSVTLPDGTVLGNPELE